MTREEIQKMSAEQLTELLGRYGYAVVEIEGETRIIERPIHPLTFPGDLEGLRGFVTWLEFGHTDGKPTSDYIQIS